MKKGDIFWTKDVPMASVKGEFAYKTRPVVVISGEKAIDSGIIQVLPVTSKLDMANQNPSHIFIDSKSSQLNVPSLALPEQICTVPASAFITYAGHVGEEAMKLIEKSILMQLGID